MLYSIDQTVVHRQHLQLVDEFVFLKDSAQSVQDWVQLLREWTDHQAKIPPVTRWIVDLRRTSAANFTELTEPQPCLDLTAPLGGELRVAFLTDSATLFEKALKTVKSLFNATIHAKWFNTQSQQRFQEALDWVLED